MTPFWWAIVSNGVIFLAFFGCCSLHHWLTFRKHQSNEDHLNHAILAGIFNPASVDSIKDFITHIVVYSGYVIPPH